MRFWDTSALVPLLVDEPLSAPLQALLREDQEIVLWWGTPVECPSALARATREGNFNSKAERLAFNALELLQAGCFEVLPTSEVRSRAQRLIRVHVLRAGDALQLASALAWCGEAPSRAGFVCLDLRLREAARKEGFELLPEGV
ncbi:MAG: type II toxin-antitoxin system VapC family toxin [Acidobacteriota bacterium]